MSKTIHEATPNPEPWKLWMQFCTTENWWHELQAHKHDRVRQVGRIIARLMYEEQTRHTNCPVCGNDNSEHVAGCDLHSLSEYLSNGASR